MLPHNADILFRYFADFTPVQQEQFAALGPLYKEWNEKINVISRKDIDSLYEKHILHSLSIAAAFAFRPGISIMDLGTGGGFPGIPLAIFFPEVKFHLVDSIAKKLKVADAIAETIGMKNITTEHTRVEMIRKRKFQFVVSRAVAPLKDLWHWSKPLLSPQSVTLEDGSRAGGLVCLKGGDLSTEIQESGTRPRMMEIKQIFPEPVFDDKYLLYISL
jgi:16S rRNA (guanine527-N7)-methyltransferase